MEHVECCLDDKKFDEAVHGSVEDLLVLPECGDLAFYVKKNATVKGKPMVVVTFHVQLPDKRIARAQAVTTLANFEGVMACMRGWKEGGHLA